MNIEYNTTIVTNIEEVAAHIGTDVDHLKRTLYKYTGCGAWIEWTDATVSIGSIVEGSDAEFSQTFTFPFQAAAIDAWIEELEYLTDEAWHMANDDEPAEWLEV